MRLPLLSLSSSPQKVNITFSLWTLHPYIPLSPTAMASWYWVLCFSLEQNPHLIVNTDTTIHLAGLVLTLNSFELNGQFFDQISGIAMGTKMVTSCACLFMGHLEYLIWLQDTGRILELYCRYIDDGIGVIDMPLSDLKNFISSFSNFHLSIQLPTF